MYAIFLCGLMLYVMLMHVSYSDSIIMNEIQLNSISAEYNDLELMMDQYKNWHMVLNEPRTGKEKVVFWQHLLTAAIPCRPVTILCKLSPSFFIVVIISCCICLNVFDLSFGSLYQTNCHNGIKGWRNIKVLVKMWKGSV
jgi:hypothetical protein